jgi:hypothetical protein
MKTKLVLSAVLFAAVIFGSLFSSRGVLALGETDWLDLSNFGFWNKQMDLALQRVGNATASGQARISVNHDDDLYEISVRVSASQLAPVFGQVFEGWLIDENSNYNLSLGAFVTNRNGRGTLRFSQDMVNFPIYDKVAISREPVNDTNPNPGVIILQANLESDFIKRFSAQLSGANEVPSNNSTATGTANFTIDTKNNVLFFDVRISGLEAAETGAHIHGFAPPGQNAGVIFNLPLGAVKMGNWQYDQSIEQQILSGLTYVNVHSVKYPDGEIRAQLVP